MGVRFWGAKLIGKLLKDSVWWLSKASRWNPHFLVKGSVVSSHGLCNIAQHVHHMHMVDSGFLQNKLKVETGENPAQCLGKDELRKQSVAPAWIWGWYYRSSGLLRYLGQSCNGRMKAGGLLPFRAFHMWSHMSTTDLGKAAIVLIAPPVNPSTGWETN